MGNTLCAQSTYDTPDTSDVRETNTYASVVVAGRLKLTHDSETRFDSLLTSGLYLR